MRSSSRRRLAKSDFPFVRDVVKNRFTTHIEIERKSVCHRSKKKKHFYNTACSEFFFFALQTPEAAGPQLCFFKASRLFRKNVLHRPRMRQERIGHSRNVFFGGQISYNEFNSRCCPCYSTATTRLDLLFHMTTVPRVLSGGSFPCLRQSKTSSTYKSPGGQGERNELFFFFFSLCAIISNSLRKQR